MAAAGEGASGWAAWKAAGMAGLARGQAGVVAEAVEGQRAVKVEGLPAGPNESVRWRG